MPDVPAICRTCGTVFPSGIFAENSRGLTITGCTAGPGFATVARCGSRSTAMKPKRSRPSGLRK
jgi:hypothetical protein